MVAAGLQDSTIAHAEAVTNMAFDMRARAGEVVEPGSNKLLQVSPSLPPSLPARNNTACCLYLRSSECVECEVEV